MRAWWERDVFLTVIDRLRYVCKSPGKCDLCQCTSTFQWSPIEHSPRLRAGGRLGPAAQKFIDEVVAECEMPEAARKAAASKIMRAIGIEVMHKQAYMMATLVQELRNEEQFMADFAHGVV